MPIATRLEFPNVTQEDYDQLGAHLAAAGPPAGIHYHACGPCATGWCIAEIWESQAAFDQFIDERLLPAMRAIGGPEPTYRETFETYHAGPVTHPSR